MALTPEERRAFRDIMRRTRLNDRLARRLRELLRRAEDDPPDEQGPGGARVREPRRPKPGGGSARAVEQEPRAPESSPSDRTRVPAGARPASGRGRRRP
jgi:hypothetical protein